MDKYANYTNLENHSADTEAVQIDYAQIIWALEHNAEFFIQFFLGEQLTFPVPEFHKEAFNFMVSKDVKLLALAIPRGHAKTTLAKLAVVWYLLFSKYRFIVYVSNTAEIAQAAVRDIWEFLNCPNFVAVFGPIEKVWMDRKGDGFFIFELMGKRCIIRALGSNQQVRGLNVDNERPELGVVDDLEDEKNTATETLQKQLKNWVYGPFFKAFNRWNRKIIWLGNMLSNTSLLKAHCDSSLWHSMLYGCLTADGSPLWPELWPIDEIRIDYISYQEAGTVSNWFAEMMNQPIPSGGGIIRSEEISYRPNVLPGSLEYVFMVIDPAISKKTWADFTGFSVHGYFDGAWQIVFTFKVRCDPIQMFHMMCEFCREWRIRVVAIEGIAYQAAIETFFKHLLAENRLTGWLEIVMLHSSRSKTERLLAWCSLLKNRSYYLSSGDVAVTNELLQYDPARPKNVDDLADSCAYGPQVTANYMHLIAQDYDPAFHTATPRLGHQAAGI